MFNEIIYPNIQPVTDNIDESICLVGVYAPSTIQDSLDTSSIDSLSTDFAITNPPTETTSDYPYWVYEPLIAICDFPPLSIGEIHILPIDTTATDPAVTDSPIDPFVYTDYFDPIFVTDPTVFDYSDVFYYTYNPVVFDSSSEFYLTTDPIFTFDPIDVSDPTIETGTIEIDPTTDSSEVTNASTDTSTTDSIATDSIDTSYYTKDPIISVDPVVITDPILDSVTIFADSPEIIYNLYDSNVDTSTDPTITETPVYKDDSTATEALISTDSTINDLSDVTILNHFRPTEINYRGISFQAEVSLELTDTLVINPTIEAGISLVDLSTENSISLSPAANDPSIASFLIDPSLALGSITHNSTFTTGKAKK